MPNSRPIPPSTVETLLRHFGLTVLPFARAVPEGGLLEHKSFAETLARLHLAVESKTAMLLTAEPGLGKSTLLGVFADGLDKSRVRLVYSALCSCGPFGLIGQLAVRYGVKPKRSAAQTAQGVLDELQRTDKQEILVLDEGHRLPHVSLDELRLLSNLDFDRTPPFTLILAGQPPLRETLGQPELASLWQRLPVRASLSPLSDHETADYLDRRLRAAGAQATLFRPGAVDKLFEKSRGIPREVNNFATAALLAAATAGKKHIDVREVEDAAYDQENS
jgi:type II secretory pathway predicted ATPase ExeA